MKRIIFLLATVAGLTSWSQADFQRGAQTIALFGGLGGSSARYDFNGPENRPVTGGGPAFGVQYLYYVANVPSIALGVDLSSSLNGDRRDDDLISGYDTTARLRSQSAMVIARLAYPRGTWRPYLFGGVGAHQSSLRLSAQPVSGGPSQMFIDQNHTSFAMGYGIGLDIFARESFFFGPELRGIWLAKIERDTTPAARAAGVRVDDDNEEIAQGNVFLRLGYRF